MRVVAQPVAAFLRAQHEKHGVAIRTNAQVTRIDGAAGRVHQVVLADGTALDADLVVVGIGSLPNVELAQSAGLQCRDGVVVDRFGRTSDPRIFAAGDCAFYAGPYTRGGMRLESVQNATDQARVAGASIAGVEKAYDSIPWFWSDQYTFKLQITGVSKGHTSFVTRGDAESLAVFYFKDDACIAVDTINRPRDHMASRRLIPGGVTRQRLEAANYDFAALMPARRRPAETPPSSPAAG
jgi:3-phenylpropionate/trans-cinnamate dioxygenase ferredoxin reductase subunit